MACELGGSHVTQLLDPDEMSSKELHDATLAMVQVMQENKTRLGTYFTFHLMERAGQVQTVMSVFSI